MNDHPGNPVLTGETLLSVPAVETHLLRSRHVQQTFKIQVMLPGRRKGDNRRYPVVYATDGNWVFDMFKGISCLLQMSADDSPPFILVSIGWPGDSPHAGMALRVREFTYPPYPDWDGAAIVDLFKRDLQDPNVNIFEGTLLPEEGTKDHYGAEDFRRFISDELVPFIDGKYATAPGDRTYFGHSGGGYFGLFTLFTQPELFRNYIVSSPGVLYHGRTGGAHHEQYDCGVQMARTFIASGKPLNGIKLYMSVGSEEEFEPSIDEHWRAVSGFYQFANVIKKAAIPGLEFMTEVFHNETHTTVWPIAFIHGVQVALGTRRVSRSVFF